MEVTEVYKIGACSVELVNFKLMRKLMDKYGSSLGTKLYYRVLTNASKITSTYLRSHTPVAEKDITKSRKIYVRGTLKRSVGIKRSKLGKKQTYAIWVGYRAGGRNIRTDAWFRHFQEGGTKERFQVGKTIKGKYVKFDTPKSLGKMPQLKLMETGWDATKAAVAADIRENIDMLINKIWNGKDWV